MLRKIIAALVGVTLAACSPTTPPKSTTEAPAQGRPALWKLADEDTTIWLFGTIHALPPGYQWRDAAIDKALTESDMLVVEAVLDRNDPAKAMALLTRLGVTPGLPPLVERVPADKRPALAALIARSKLPEQLLNGMETWTGALMLMPVVLGDLGVAGGTGVEEQLEDDFRAAGKPIEGLETAEQQLGVLDGLPEAAQREFLATLAEDSGKDRIEFEKMLKAWSTGDEKGIAASFDTELKHSPVLRDALLTRRNAAWVEWLKARLDKPGTVFLAVGAGHLAGRESVVRMLEAQGLKAERVQ